MKERFEKRRLIGSLNISCKFDDGTTRVWSADKAEVVQHIVDIVDEYDKLGYKLSLRQLYYQLVSNNWIINHDSAYHKLGRILDDCRYAGVIDWNSIADRGRVPYLPYAVNSVGEAVRDTHDTYRRDRQEGQDFAIELWTEKDALSEILRRSTDKYHVRMCVNKGYTSSSAMYDAYKRVLGYLNTGRPTTILYLGDHDPSGLDMVRDIRERLHFMLANGRHKEIFADKIEKLDSFCDIQAIGLTIQQVRQYKLPPNPTKLTDARAEGYIRQFGKQCWEVDALRPQVLTALVEQSIEAIIDVEKFKTMLYTEQADRDELKQIAEDSGYQWDEQENDEQSEDEYDEQSEDEYDEE